MRTLTLLALLGMAIAACEGAGTEAPSGIDTPSATRTSPSEGTPVPTSGARPSPIVTKSGACVPPPAVAPALSGVFCADTRGMEAARVARIVDGDTLEVVVDGRTEDLRLFGIDAAERGDRCFGEASGTLATLAGEEVYMLPDARNRDPYGRLLRYLYTPEGLSIDAMMIGVGLARAWTRDGALRDPLVALEEDARAARRGCLWKAP